MDGAQAHVAAADLILPFVFQALKKRGDLFDTELLDS